MTNLFATLSACCQKRFVLFLYLFQHYCAQYKRQGEEARAIKTGSQKRIYQALRATQSAFFFVEPVVDFVAEITPGEESSYEKNEKFDNDEFFHGEFELFFRMPVYYRFTICTMW